MMPPDRGDVRTIADAVTPHTIASDRDDMPTLPVGPRSSPPPPRKKLPAVAWVAIVGLLAVPPLIVGVFVLVWITDDGPAVQVEAALGAAVEAMERYQDGHGRYAEEALDRDRQLRGANPKVQIAVHVRDDGYAYCLEGSHADVHPPVASYDSSRGLVRDAPC
jgi:hypothetical protein